MEESKQNFDNLKHDLKEIIIDKQELCNILVWLSYKRKFISKAFVWSMVGEVILENILDKNNRIIHFPIKDDNGDIKYDGDGFRMAEKIIGKKEVI